MSGKEKLKLPGRRAFFKKAGAGIGAAGVAAVGLSGTSARAAVKADKDFKKSSYRETEHVKKYYETARF
ncbi:MAG: formate dehydrogenase [Alphaproteobacteria bacterium]